MIFADPRCPSHVLDLKDKAFASTYLIFAYTAFAQDDNPLAEEFLRKAIEFNPSLVQGNPCELVDSFVTIGASTERKDLQDLVRNLFSHLPSQFVGLSSQQDWALARGYLLKGARAAMWGEAQHANTLFHQAAELGAQVDERFLQMVTFQILGYEAEFGEQAARSVIDAIAGGVETVAGQSKARRLKGSYWFNRAFQNYHGGDYHCVVQNVLRAASDDPTYLANRGLWSITFRSLIERFV
jgi:hypothetical protein